MIKTIIKLAIAGLALFSLYHVGIVYWDHYQFQDSVQELAQFAENETADQIRGKVMDLANARDIPLDPGDLLVTREPQGRGHRDMLAGGAGAAALSEGVGFHGARGRGHVALSAARTSPASCAAVDSSRLVSSATAST